MVRVLLKDSKVGELKRVFCEPMQTYWRKLNNNRNQRFFTDTNPSKGERKSQIYYKCQSCDHTLFEGINVLININYDKNVRNDCPKLFIEPIKWMIPLICKNKSSQIDCPNVRLFWVHSNGSHITANVFFIINCKTRAFQDSKVFSHSIF